MKKMAFAALVLLLGLGSVFAALTEADLSPKVVNRTMKSLKGEARRTYAANILRAIAARPVDGVTKVNELTSAARALILGAGRDTILAIAEVYNTIPVEQLPGVAELLSKNNFSQKVNRNADGTPLADNIYDELAVTIVKRCAEYLETSGTDSPALRISILAATFTNGSTNPDRTRPKIYQAVPESVVAAVKSYVPAAESRNNEVMAAAAGVDAIEETPETDPDADNVVAAKKPEEEEAAKKAAEEQAAKKAAEEQAAKKAAEEQAAKKAEADKAAVAAQKATADASVAAAEGVMAAADGKAKNEAMSDALKPAGNADALKPTADTDALKPSENSLEADGSVLKPAEGTLEAKDPAKVLAGETPAAPAADKAATDDAPAADKAAADAAAKAAAADIAAPAGDAAPATPDAKPADAAGTPAAPKAEEPVDTPVPDTPDARPAAGSDDDDEIPEAAVPLLSRWVANKEGANMDLMLYSIYDWESVAPDRVLRNPPVPTLPGLRNPAVEAPGNPDLGVGPANPKPNRPPVDILPPSPGYANQDI